MNYFSHAILSVLLFAGVSMAETGTEPRQSMTNESYSEHQPLQLRESSVASSEGSTKQRSGYVGSLSDPNFWFYDVDVAVFSDFDRDGYYFGLDLEFDADTNYTFADVYAVLYLSYEYGPWNLYAETDNFTLFGTSSTDDYRVETELVSGYLTGSYDILIELYDAHTNAFLTSIGPEQSAELSLLPLEDSTRDSPGGGETQVVVNSGGGSLGWLLLLGLLAVRMTLRPQAARLSK